MTKQELEQALAGLEAKQNDPEYQKAYPCSRPAVWETDGKLWTVEGRVKEKASELEQQGYQYTGIHRENLKRDLDMVVDGPVYDSFDEYNFDRRNGSDYTILT